MPPDTTMSSSMSTQRTSLLCPVSRWVSLVASTPSLSVSLWTVTLVPMVIRILLLMILTW